MEPDLSLGYNSQAGIGILGKGWSINGLSTITRISTSHFLESGLDEAAYISGSYDADYSSLPVDFNENDRFALDGQRLVLVGGTDYHSSDAEYRTEIDSISRVKAHGTLNGSPDYFTVETKSGLKMTYGNTANSPNSKAELSVYDTGFQGPVDRTLTWALNKIEDTVGNEILFTYFESNGAIRPHKITYAVNGTFECEVVFGYTSGQDADTVPAYLGGGSFRNDFLMNSIACYEDGTLIREYVIAYSSSTSTGVSLIETITLHAGGDNLPPTEFTYQERSIANEFSKSNPQPEILGVWAGDRGLVAQTRLGDINGDGFQDIIKQTAINSNTHKIEIFEYDPAESSFEHNTGFDKTLTSYSYSELDGGNLYKYDNNLAVQFGDVNGDFKDDLVTLKRSDLDIYTTGIDEITGETYRTYTIKETYYVYLSVEDQSGNRKFEDFPSIIYTGPSGDPIINVIQITEYLGAPIPGEYVSELGFNEWRFELVDFNGDGRQDILRHTSDGFGYQLFRSMGDDFDKVNEPSGIGGVDDKTYENGVVLPVDYRYFLDANSDGMADMFFADGDLANDEQKVRLYLSDGQGYDISSPLTHTVGPFITDDPLTSAPESVIFPGDFNGDGMIDFAYAYKIPDTEFGIIKTWLFSGTNWISGGQTDQFNWRDDADFMGIDSNGDGRTDLVHIYKDSLQEKLTLWQSLGDSFASSTTPQTIDTWRDDRRYHQVDLDGDGKGDLARLTKNSSNLEADYWTSNGLVPDLLTGVMDGLGAKAVVEYRPLSNDIVHEDSSSSLSYPNVPYVGGLHVVHKLGKDEGFGIAAGDYITQYWYSGGGLHVWGRGFLGFRVFKSEDLEMGKVRIETANLQFPFIGMSQLVENYMPDPLTSDVELVSRTVNQFNSYTTKTKTFTEGPGSVSRSHKSWFPYYSQSKKEKKEVSDENGISASYFSAVLTTNNYRDSGGNGDLHGNPRDVTIDYFDYSVSTTQPQITEKTENTQWLNIETIDDWMPSRLKASRVTFSRVNETSKTRTSEFIYAHSEDTDYTGSSTHGMLHKEVSEPNDVQNKIETSYTYDTNGNILEKQVDAADIEYNGGNPVISTKTIKTVYTYTTDGRFIKEKKTQGASADSTIDQVVKSQSFKQGFALPTATRDINDLKTEIDYDAFGRTTKKRKYGKTLADADYLVSETTIDYLFSASGAPSLTATAIKSETLSASSDVIVPEATTFVDRLGRTLRNKSRNADGEIVYVDTEYDEFGRVRGTSEPYFSGGSATYWTINTYDSAGRPKLVTQDVEDPADPDSGVKKTIQTKYLYDGFEHTIISDFGGTNPQSTKKTTNVKGEVVRIDQEEGAYMLYFYDAFGNLRQVTDSQGNDTVISYDGIGRFKESMTDPDMGTWTYTYNSLGELKWQIDNSNTVTTLEYDFLGRMIRRETIQSGVSASVDTWIFDSASGLSHGKLASESGGDSYQKTYTYSNSGFGELVRESSTILGQTFDLEYGYDSNRRLEKIWDPQGRCIKNIYNSYGALDKVEGWDSGGLDHTWWEATDVDHLNRIQAYNLAGGTMKGRQVFKGGSGLVSYIESGVGPSTTDIFQSRYSYDKLGNVTQRQMVSPRSLSETFTYDGLNRLKTWTVSGHSTQTATYDAIGNVTSRTDISNGATWSYDTARPHAVTVAGSNTYSYDDNGNLETRNGSSIWWLPFNKPRAIFSAENSYTFYYDNNRNRVVETIIQDGRWRSRVKVGSLYEEVYDDGVKSYRLSIPTPMGVVGVWTVGDEGEFRTYNHNDLLGSVGIITNENGVVQKEYAYDPWGAPRDPISWTTLSDWPDYKDDRGYTGHEMLEGLELVHMNGRIYDPAIGRFLTADPFIQFSGDSQSYNRYAYVLNNPMRYSDPSGHFVQFLVPVAAWIADNAVLVAAIYGGISGYQEGGLKGAFYGAAFGAITGAISSGIGKLFGSTAWGSDPLFKATMKELSRAVAHGVTMGALSEAVGGDFGSAFEGAFFGSLAGHAAEGLGLDIENSFLVAVMVGGTITEIGGGKFANGAMSSAFTFMVNQLANQPAQGGDPYYVGRAKSVITDENGVTHVRVRVLYKDSEGNILTLDNAKVAEFKAGFEKYWTNSDANVSGRLDVVTDPSDGGFITATINAGTDVAHAAVGGRSITHFMDDDGWTAAHELGHSLGLSHGDQGSSPGIMGPGRNASVNAVEMQKVYRLNAPSPFIMLDLETGRN